MPQNNITMRFREFRQPLIENHINYLRGLAAVIVSDPEHRQYIEDYVLSLEASCSSSNMHKWLIDLLNGKDPFSFSSYIDANANGLCPLSELDNWHLRQWTIGAHISPDNRQNVDDMISSYDKPQKLIGWYNIIMDQSFCFPFMDYVIIERNSPRPTFLGDDVAEIKKTLKRARNLQEWRTLIRMRCAEERSYFVLEYDCFGLPDLAKKRMGLTNKISKRNNRWYDVLSATNIQFHPRHGTRFFLETTPSVPSSSKDDTLILFDNFDAEVGEGHHDGVYASLYPRRTSKAAINTNKASDTRKATKRPTK